MICPTLTTAFPNRLDPRQASEVQIAVAARELLDLFGGDRDRAGLWIMNETIAFDRAGDQTRKLVAVRIGGALHRIV